MRANRTQCLKVGQGSEHLKWEELQRTLPRKSWRRSRETEARCTGLDPPVKGQGGVEMDQDSSWIRSHQAVRGIADLNCWKQFGVLCLPWCLCGMVREQVGGFVTIVSMVDISVSFFL